MAKEGIGRSGDPHPLRWSGPPVPAQHLPPDLLRQLQMETGELQAVDDLPPWASTLAGGEGEPPRRGAIRHRAGSVRSPDLDASTDWRLTALLAGVLVALVAGAGGLIWTWRDISTPAAAPAPASHTLLTVLTGSRGQMVAGGVIGVDRTSAVCLLTPAGLAVDRPGGAVPLLEAMRGTGPRTGQAAASAVSKAVGVDVQDTWVLTAAELQSLVQSVGGVPVDVPRAVSVDGTVVPRGTRRVLSGRSAAAYATASVAGDSTQFQLARFYEVMEGLLGRMPADPDELGRMLGRAGNDGRTTLAGAEYAQVLLPLREQVLRERLDDEMLPLTPVSARGRYLDGVQGPQMSRVLVGPLARAQLSAPPGAALHVEVQDAVGAQRLRERVHHLLAAARLNYVSGGSTAAFGQTPTAIVVPSRSAVDMDHARTVAMALGIPAAAVRTNARTQLAGDVLVVLGSDFRT